MSIATDWNTVKNRIDNIFENTIPNISEELGTAIKYEKSVSTITPEKTLWDKITVNQNVTGSTFIFVGVVIIGSVLFAKYF